MIFDSDFTATIDGAGVTSPTTMGVVNPATGEVFAQAPNCGAAELDAAVAAARKAFVSWRATPLAERQRLVKALGAHIAAHKNELARLLTAEQGKPLAEANGEIMGGVYWCDVFGGMDIPVVVTEDNDERRVEVRRSPLGVVGALSPWNFPVILAMLKVAPALVAGNTVILKPSPFTPLTTLKLGELAREILPAGVFSVVSGDDALGPLMTTHPGIDKISFTGSTATGRKVMASASASLKRITLELGGNDAAIVLPDVDIDLVAKQIFNSAFGNSGQVCVAVKRLYVHDDIYDRFTAALIALAGKAKVGHGNIDGTRHGPVQNAPQFERVKDLIADAKAKGYRFLAGGGEQPAATGYFLPLTLIDELPDDARIVREEQFGPVLPILRFSDVDDVVRRANDSPYGLGGQIWSGDLDVADAIGERLEVGNVWINQVQAMYAHSPFGGHKSSGIGVESSLEGLLAFTNAQTVAVRKRSVAA